MKQKTTQQFMTFVLSALVLTLFPISQAHSELQKPPDHIYICTFNVYKLGSVDPKYTSLDEEDEKDSSPAPLSIPWRIKNLANVLTEWNCLRVE